MKSDVLANHCARRTPSGTVACKLKHISQHFSPDVTDNAPQIGFHKGFFEGVEYRAYGPLKNILCGIKDQAGSVASGEKCRLKHQTSWLNGLQVQSWCLWTWKVYDGQFRPSSEYWRVSVSCRNPDRPALFVCYRRETMAKRRRKTVPLERSNLSWQESLCRSRP